MDTAASVTVSTVSTAVSLTVIAFVRDESQGEEIRRRGRAREDDYGEERKVRMVIRMLVTERTGDRQGDSWLGESVGERQVNRRVAGD